MNFLFLILLMISNLFISSCGSWQSTHPSSESALNYRVLWSKSFDPIFDSGNPSISFNAPTIHQELLFVGGPTGKFGAYYLQNGRELWTVKEEGSITGQPGVFNDLVIYGNDRGRIFARNTLTGALIFEVEIGDAIESDPVFHKDRILFQLRGHKVICLDAQSGKILWSYKRNVSSMTTIHGSSAVFADNNRLFTGFADGYVVSLALEDGSLLWEQKISLEGKFLDVDMTPVVLDNVLYSASISGPLTLLNAENGEILARLSMSSVRSPVWSEDRKVYYVVSPDGYAYILGNQNQVILEKKISSVNIASFALWKGHLAVSTIKGEVYFLNKDTLEPAGKFSLGNSKSTIYNSMDLFQNILSFYTSRNRLYVLEKI